MCNSHVHIKWCWRVSLTSSSSSTSLNELRNNQMGIYRWFRGNFPISPTLTSTWLPRKTKQKKIASVSCGYLAHSHTHTPVYNNSMGFHTKLLRLTIVCCLLCRDLSVDWHEVVRALWFYYDHEYYGMTDDVGASTLLCLGRKWQMTNWTEETDTWRKMMMTMNDDTQRETLQKEMERKRKRVWEWNR